MTNVNQHGSSSCVEENLQDGGKEIIQAVNASSSEGYTDSTPENEEGEIFESTGGLVEGQIEPGMVVADESFGTGSSGAPVLAVVLESVLETEPNGDGSPTTMPSPIITDGLVESLPNLERVLPNPNKIPILPLECDLDVPNQVPTLPFHPVGLPIIPTLPNLKSSQNNLTNNQATCCYSLSPLIQTGVVPSIGKSALLQYFNQPLPDFSSQKHFSSNSLVVSTSFASKPTCNQGFPLLKEKGLDLSVDLVPLSCDNQSIAKNNREVASLSEEEDRESGPPGFNSQMGKSSEENSVETAIHVTEETSSSEEEINGFSSSRARMVQEKLGISVLGMGNADKAFADFCRNRQKETENVRKKSVVPDMSINLKNHLGKKGYRTRRIVEGGKKKVRS